MDTYVTGSTIRLLREAKGLTQAELAGKLAVSAKTIRANGGVLEDEAYDSLDGTLTQRYWIENR